MEVPWYGSKGWTTQSMAQSEQEGRKRGGAIRWRSPGIKPGLWSYLSGGCSLFGIKPGLWFHQSGGRRLPDIKPGSKSHPAAGGVFFCAVCNCAGCNRGCNALLLITDSFRCRKDELSMLRHSCHTGTPKIHHIWGVAILCPVVAWTDYSSVYVHVRRTSCRWGMVVVQEGISVSTASNLWSPRQKLPVPMRCMAVGFTVGY